MALSRLRQPVISRAPNLLRARLLHSSITSSSRSISRASGSNDTCEEIGCPSRSTYLSSFHGCISKQLQMRVRNFTSESASHIVVQMPALSPTMSQGNISKWLKKEGDKIEVGDVLCEIETDKATLEFECLEEGYLAKILMPEGSKDVQVGQPIAVTVEDAEDIQNVAASVGSGSIIETSASETVESKDKSEQTGTVAYDTSDLPPHVVEDKPADLTADSTAEQKQAHAAWTKVNNLCLKFLRLTTASNIKSSIPESDALTAKGYLHIITECFKPGDKAVVGKLMAELTTTRYDGTKTMQQHVLDMANLAAKLAKLSMKVEDSFLVQFILNSLPQQYGPFQIHYNTINETWNVNQLTNKLVQEEARIKQQNSHVPTANYVYGNWKQKFGKKHWKDNKKCSSDKNNSSNQPSQPTFKKAKKNDNYHFCKNNGHIQKDCVKRKAWFEKKGIPYNPEHKTK